MKDLQIIFGILGFLAIFAAAARLDVRTFEYFFHWRNRQHPKRHSDINGHHQV